MTAVLLAGAGIAVGTITAGAAAADTPSPSGATSATAATAPDPDLMAEAQEVLDERAAEVAEIEITDAMRAAAVIDLTGAGAALTIDADDAAFDLRPDDSTITVERTAEVEDDTVVTLTADLLFEFGEAALTDAAQAAVADLAATIPQDAAVLVTGHTDSVGEEDFNLTLSQQRAQAVADVLAAARPDLGLTVEGHGEAEPVADNEVDGVDNPAGRALNRRVEVTYPTG